MDVARWTQRPEIYPDRDLERLLGIVCDSRGRALRGNRLAWHREPVIEPATPARNPTTPRSQVLRAWTRQVGAGKKEKNKNKKNTPRVSPAPAQLHRLLAARSSNPMNTLKNKSVEESYLLGAFIWHTTWRSARRRLFSSPRLCWGVWARAPRRWPGALPAQSLGIQRSS